MYKEQDILKAYEKARRGSRDYYEDFCTMMFDEVRMLVALVYEKESNINKLVNHIFNKLRPKLGEFDPSKEDIHRWVSVFASKMIYSVYNMSNSDVFAYNEANADYEIGYIEEDEEFAECAIYYNRKMTGKEFSKAGSAFSMLTKGQIILYELFCYAGCTVEEIEDMLEVDGIYICSELCDIKKVLVREHKAATWVAGGASGKRVEKAAKVAVASVATGDAVKDAVADVADDYDDGIQYESADYDAEDYDAEDYDDSVDYDSEDVDSYSADYDDSDDDSEDDEEESKYAAYLKGRPAAVTGSAPRKRRPQKKKSGIVAMFDGMSDKTLKLIGMIIIALILLVILFVILFFVGNDNKKPQTPNRPGYEQQTGENSSSGGNSETEGQSSASGETKGESEAETTGATVGQTEAEKESTKNNNANQEETTTKAPQSSEVTTEAQKETEASTETPTEAPTEAPTETPTEVPTEAPTDAPTEATTEAPQETQASTTAPESGTLTEGEASDTSGESQ